MTETGTARVYYAYEKVIPLCIWCKKDAEDKAKWISINGVPRVPLCHRCQADVEKVAQALIVFGRFVLPKMRKQ